MDETLSEKEQIEEIRAWWKENGNYVIAGLVLGIGGIFGFNQWKSANLNAQLEASALYESLVTEVADNRLDPAELIAANIYTNYAETVYADEARLAMARLFMDQGRDEDAASELRELVSSGGFKELQMIGRLRLGKILLYQGKAEEVLTLIEGHTDNAFAPRLNEIIGDAHFALGNFEMAQIAYQQALSEPAATQVLDANLVQMKINDLPEILPAGESIDEPSIIVPAGDAAESGDETDVVASDVAEDEETPE